MYLSDCLLRRRTDDVYDISRNAKPCRQFLIMPNSGKERKMQEAEKEQNPEILKAIELLNKNGYIVAKINKAQMAIAELCNHNDTRCTFNLLGIRCVDLLCAREMIREQVLPYLPEDNEEQNKE